MSRNIEAGKRLSKADRDYVLERSWLRHSLGVTLDDLQVEEVEDDHYEDVTEPPHDPEDLIGLPQAGDGEKAEGAESAESAESGESGDSYDQKTVAQLVDVLKERKLSVTGNKAELVTRLREDDAKE